MTAFAYLAGVLHGDGWCSATIGLKVKDRDFAETFAVALELAYGCTARPHRDGDYWRVMARNDSHGFDSLRAREPVDDGERAAWLRGLFDSEGNAQLRRMPKGGWGRRVAFYSTNTTTLERANGYLQELGIDATTRQQKASQSHRGLLQVYELSLAQNRENFLRFAWLVGSNILRKREVLLRIPLTYQVDMAESCRKAQRIGATSRHRRTMEDTLPRVVAAVRQLIDQGVKPTQRNCLAIPGYPSIQRHVRQADLVHMAESL